MNGTTLLRTVVNVMMCLLSLETLAISGPGLIWEDTAVGMSDGPTRLVHLDLLHIPSDPIFSWLLSVPVVPVLKSLRIVMYWQRGDKGSAVKEYFERAGKRLESLDIAGVHCWTDSLGLQRRILPYTTNLHSLTFSSQDAINILDTLALLPASWEGAHWIALDAALTASHTLKRFSILEYDARGLVVTPLIRHLMPLASARGILD
ncbi:hypothetical protein C8R44DRAFT_855290 [Mycena epipterygia]|nr:hypothetical protein C8R44DRAFT_855290 [Mycena epipterygia]